MDEIASDEIACSLERNIDIILMQHGVAECYGQGKRRRTTECTVWYANIEEEEEMKSMEKAMKEKKSSNGS